jgi:hypothetical protein
MCKKYYSSGSNLLKKKYLTHKNNAIKARKYVVLQNKMGGKYKIMMI